MENNVKPFALRVQTARDIMTQKQKHGGFE